MSKDTRAWLVTGLFIISFSLLLYLIATYPIVELVFSLVSGVIIVSAILFILKELIKKLLDETI